MYWKQCLCWLISVALSANPLAIAGAQGQQPSLNTEPLLELASAIENLAETIYSAHDLGNLLDEFDFDAPALSEFVRESIRLEPYFGSLKGAPGTLSARSGNALDQSLLLATLLNDAGYDARIVRGELSSIEASRLARAALAPSVEPQLTVDQVAFERALERLAGLQESRAEPFPGSSRQAIEPSEGVVAVAARLAELVELEDSTDEIVTALKDYFWVEWRDGPGSAWQSVHPGFGAEQPPQGLEPKEFFTRQIPEELQHRVRFEMGIERLEAGQLHAELIADPWERPTSNFFDTPITTGVLALHAEVSGETPRLFVPLFNGQVAPGGRAFSLLGQVVDLSAAASSAAGVFESVTRGFLSAAEELADRPDDQPLMTLSGQFIRVTWIRPDGRTRAEERWLLDRLTNRGEPGVPPRIDASIDDAAIVDLLSYLRTYIVQAPGQHTAWGLKRSLEAQASQLRWAHSMLQMLDWETGELAEESARLPAPRNDRPLLMMLASMTHQPVKLDADQLTWREGPFVAALHEILPADELSVPTRWVDIHFNPWRAARIADAGIESWPKGQILRGVLDTAWEDSIGSPGQGYLDAAPDAIALIAAPAHAAQYRDLAQGFVLASIPPVAEQEMRWWRVHPQTGEVLGMRTIGGAIITEELVGLILISVGSFLLTRAIFNCLEYEGWTRGCCYASIAVFGVSTVAGIFGGVAGATLGMTVGTALAVGAISLVAALAIDTAQSMAADIACKQFFGNNRQQFTGERLVPCG